MATERVGKDWQSKGIDTFSNEAILATLAHYGVVIDEAGFKALANDDFPFGIAMRWHKSWKGTGQFSRFPASAADELWRRWLPGQLSPGDVALGLIKLLQTLADRLDGKADDGTLDTRFKVVEAFLAKIPETRRDAFVGEAIGAMGEWMEPFDGIAEALEKKKHSALADRFVAIEEALLVERAGIMSSILRAERGDKPGAIEAISAIANDVARSPFNRLSAVDALFDFEDTARAKAALFPLFDAAEQSKDLEFISEVVERLSVLLERDRAMPERHELRRRIEALAALLGPGDDGGEG